MHHKQAAINRRWDEEGLPPFGLGLGLSTGEAAAALLGSEERLEYTLVGDTVNMSQRLQQLADAGEIVVSQGTVDAWERVRETVALPAQLVKGRETPVIAYKLVGDGCRPGDVLAKEGG
jgi:adenylate cyclase